MFVEQTSPQRQIGGPQSNYLSYFQMQICVTKSTKQLKMQIERVLCCSFSICWEAKEMKHFHQDFALCFLR